MTATLAPRVPNSVPSTGAPQTGGTDSASLYRLTVAQYQAMRASEIIGPDEAVELLDGLLVGKMTKNPPHVLSGKLTAIALGRLLPPGFHIATQDPFTAPTSMPEPDVCVVRGSPRDYADRHPRPADLALVVEVADATVAADRGIKRDIYAAAGVPAYWIVLLPERAVEVYADPTGPAYAPPRRYADGDRVPVVIDGREVGTVAVADLLP